MTEYKTLHDIIWSIPPKLERPTQRKDVFWYHQPYLNIYDVLTDGGNRVQFVDLGLPSGILWADRNLGASSPEDFGDGYAWGEVQTKTTFTWDNYKYGKENELTKYCEDYEKGTIDNLTELEQSDDAIYVNCGGGYMPTLSQVTELIENTTQEWTTLNGVQGMRFTGQNGNSIFIPANNGDFGVIWASTLNGNNNYGDALKFDENEATAYSEERYVGQSVRARGVITYSDLLDGILTIEATQDDTTVQFFVDDENYAKTIEVSVDGGRTWTNKTSSTSGTELAVLNTGNKLLLRGDNSAYGYYKEEISPDYGTLEITYGNTIYANKQSYVYGNIMSLINSQNFEKLHIVEDFAFPYMFARQNVSNSWVLFKNDKNLILPATIIGANSYYGMFSNCTNITYTPELPAKNINIRCYQNMFKGCTSLVTVPELPASKMFTSCYEGMFEGCTGITTAPELNSTNTDLYCYKRMFANCTSLTKAPTLRSTTVADWAYYEMFKGCSALTTVQSELPATSVGVSGYFGMFCGCSSLVTAPEIKAMSFGVEPNPRQGFSDTNCCAMFENCTSLTKAPSILPATTLTKQCYYQMFNGCTSLTTAPELPARRLNSQSYAAMFQNCTSLNYIKCLSLDTNGNNSNSWVSGVAVSGTFVKNANATWSEGSNKVPSGWTIVDAT